MSGFWLFVIISGVIAAAELSFLQWWHMRESSDEQLTLQDLMLGILASCVPVVNFFVGAAALIYIFVEVAPKIILAGSKK